MIERDKKIRPLGFEIKLAESKKSADGSTPETSDIQIMKVGDYQHPWYGNFQLTTELFQLMISNWTAKTYGIDSMIDYDHEVAEAAGWIKSLFLSADSQELWAMVQWTPPGQLCLDNKEYRYISPDFSFNYTDNEGEVQYGPVLFGAALTNRPFVKGMSAVVGLNETHGGNEMDLKELTAENVKLSEKIKTIEAASASEAKRLSDEKVELEKQITVLKTEAETSKKEGAFALLLSEGKAVPAQKEAFMKGDTVEFAKLAGKINLSETGKGGEGAEVDPKDEKAKEAKVVKLAEGFLADKSASSMGDALKMVFKQHPELK